jgi:hypothetical protein
MTKLKLDTRTLLEWLGWLNSRPDPEKKKQNISKNDVAI